MLALELVKVLIPAFLFCAGGYGYALRPYGALELAMFLEGSLVRRGLEAVSTELVEGRIFQNYRGKEENKWQ